MSRASDRQVGGGHYRDMAIQPSEFIERNGLTWHEGNAIKYICRHRMKNGELDIDKAIHYLELLKELEYEEKRDAVQSIDRALASNSACTGQGHDTYDASRGQHAQESPTYSECVREGGCCQGADE